MGHVGDTGGREEDGEIWRTMKKEVPYRGSTYTEAEELLRG